MNSLSSQVGIDVGKAFLDFSIGSAKPVRVANTVQGCKQIASSIPSESVVHLESSGGHERLIRRTLIDSGFEVKTHDPYRMRCAVRADGKRAKTDALDARNLSEKGAGIEPQHPKSQARQELCDISRSIEALKDHKKTLKMQAGTPELPAVARKALLDAAKSLEQHIRKLQTTFRKLIKESALEQGYRLVQSIPGVGPVLAGVRSANCLRRFHHSSLRSSVPTQAWLQWTTNRASGRDLQKLAQATSTLN